MPYFPFFQNIDRQPGLVVGGGTVALRKIKKLLPFGPQLTVIAPRISPDLRILPGLTLLERPFLPGDEANMSFVIAATDHRDINREISLRCQQARIPVNVVDDPELCSFIFPALVQNGDLTVGISTGGSSPTAAICLKEQIQQMIPEHFDEILEFLHTQREFIRENCPTESARHHILRRLFFAAVEAGRPLHEEEVCALCKEDLQ